MKPYYSHGGIEIYHGDCREVLASGLRTMWDAVLADPPFGIVNRFSNQKNHNGTRRLSFDWDCDNTTNNVVDALGLAFADCSSKSGVFCFCGGDQFGLILEAVRQANFTAKPACWVKECPPPAGFGNWWPSGFEFAVYGYRTGAYFGDTNPKRSNVFVHDSYRYGQPGKVDHPTQKPLGLIKRIVEAIVPPNGICVDPFGGSGTTALACKLTGRRCTTIEIEERYCEIAANRLRQEVLFGAESA